MKTFGILLIMTCSFTDGEVITSKSGRYLDPIKCAEAAQASQRRADVYRMPSGTVTFHCRAETEADQLKN